MNMSIAINIVVIILEIIGLKISISERKWKIFAYYTQISNIITLGSSMFFVASQSSIVTITLRYLSSCMLTMTFLITLFVLVPMGGGFRKLMLSGNGLYHHTICPILSVTSYLLWEQHASAWMLPASLTLAYGITMLVMNAKDKFDGPYTFFRVHNQSRAATVIWMIILIGVISVISIGIAAAGDMAGSVYRADKAKDYSKGTIIDRYRGDLDSDLSIFPDSIEDDSAKYSAYFKPNIFDTDGKMILECSYNENQFADEISRLQDLSMTIEYDTEQYTNRIVYEEDSYNYPAYITIDGFGNTYEYALIDKDNSRITYIYLAYPDKDTIQKYSNYMKRDLSVYEEENIWDAFSMYNHSFDGI